MTADPARATRDLARSGDPLLEHVTAIVLTHNEERNITACLESLKGIRRVLVVDSGSTDTTIEICRQHGIEPFHHAYENHASQWRWALESLPIETEWVLALDADFVVTTELLDRLRRDIAGLTDDVAGIYVRHRYRFGWGDIRLGGTKQSWLRIVRRGRARPDTGDLVDFRFVVDGKVATWPEAVVEYNRNDDEISVWIGKQDKFALRLAVEEELRRRRLHGWSGKPRLFGTTDERFAWLRDRWLWMPLFVRPVIYFFYRYVLALGFLDGRAGFLYAALQGFWLRVIVDWKIVELRKLGLCDEQLLAFSRTMLTTRTGSVGGVIRATERAACRSDGGA
jgi:glycosyltransferase involved in cell wall biosynthesis